MATELGDARWMAPLVHCHYDQWIYSPQRSENPLQHDPHWHLKLDRVTQFGTVFFQTREMLKKRRPRMLAYVWYGNEGQGVELFHKRLKVELREDLLDLAHFEEITPEWPMDLGDPERSFEDMMCEAFNALSFQDIPQIIRSYTRGASGLLTLIYIRHQPVRSKKLINPRTFKKYLVWLDDKFAPMLKKRYYALLTVSFMVDNPAKFNEAILNKAGLDNLPLSRTVFRLLDEMERLCKKDLLDFLQTHNIRLPSDHKDLILQNIMEQTNGHYERTISALKQMVKRAIDLSEEKVVEQEELEDEFDY